jgi:hypothetical protein
VFDERRMQISKIRLLGHDGDRGGLDNIMNCKEKY